MLDQELPHLKPNAQFVTFFIGTNDIRTLGTNPRIDLDSALRKFKSNYDLALETIHCRAPHARIVIANVPNRAYLSPSTLPVAAPPSRLDYISRWMNQNVINPYIRNGLPACAESHAPAASVQVVDLSDDGCSYDSRNLADGLHPNDRGAAILAKRFLGLPVSSASCTPVPKTSFPPFPTAAGVAEESGAHGNSSVSPAQ